MKTNGKQIVLTAMLSAVGLAGAAAGQTITEDHKVTTKEAGGGHFGWSVAAGDSFAVVGAPFADMGSSIEGAVYAIDLMTGELPFELLPDELKDGFISGFGRSVAIGGGFAAVGAFDNPISSPSSGAVYVFDVTTGQQVYRLNDLDPSGSGIDLGFGNSVAMSDSVLVVGDPHFPGQGLDTAAVYVFDRKSGVLLATATADDDDLQSSFGSTVAVSETRFAVGFEDTWQVDVFDLDSGDRMFTVTPPPLTEAIGYGNALGMSDAFLVVGTWGDRSIEGQLGAAYVYDAASGEHLRTITPPLEDEAFQFGWSVAVEDSIAVIGAFFEDEDFFDDPKDKKRGTAYVYDLETGELLVKLRPTDSELSDDFGRAVATDGQTVVVGRPGDDETGPDEGAAYIFTLPPFGCPGDATVDGTVDLADLNLVLANFGSATSEGDVTSDGEVDLADLNLVLANFGTSCG
jgi:hypothetical protein